MIDLLASREISGQAIAHPASRTAGSVWPVPQKAPPQPRRPARTRSLALPLPRSGHRLSGHRLPDTTGRDTARRDTAGRGWGPLNGRSLPASPRTVPRPAGRRRPGTAAPRFRTHSARRTRGRRTKRGGGRPSGRGGDEAAAVGVTVAGLPWGLGFAFPVTGGPCVFPRGSYPEFAVLTSGDRPPHRGAGPPPQSVQPLRPDASVTHATASSAVRTATMGV